MSAEPRQPLSRGVDHVGLAVRQLDVTLRFFLDTLGFRKVGERLEYPAVFVSDGEVLITLWQVTDPKQARAFDRHQQVGLHHLALRVPSRDALHHAHEILKAAPGVIIEAAPQPLGSGPGAHMMCVEPGGIRIEFITREA